ncbi:MAG: hypothetical protein JWO56_223, partial [Acidobacteria bacterium]|nr:hypothetical protein [Acidobacteriota bacterium]
NFYLDEGDTVTVTVYVADTGQPAAAGTLVQLATYPSNKESPTVDPTPLTVGANGLTSFTVDATRAGFRYFQFTPYAAGTTPAAPPAQIDTMVDFYCGARTLPFDDALNAHTPDWMLTWNWVYANILRAFDLNPAAVMRALGFGLGAQNIWDNPAAAAALQARIAKALFESVLYMPVTRELSNGKRNLLDRWAALVIAGTEPTGVQKALTLGVAAAPRRTLNRLATTEE